MKYKQIVAVTMSLALAGAAHSATLTNGYTTGASSQLLAANSGAGSILFADAAATGGSDVNVTGGTVSPCETVPRPHRSVEHCIRRHDCYAVF